MQCTLSALRYSSYLKKFYERIKARRGAGKAIIATARKFLGTSIFRLTLTLVGLLSWNLLPATEYQLRFSNIVAQQQRLCAVSQAMAGARRLPRGERS